jgi:hypothetical protein
VDFFPFSEGVKCWIFSKFSTSKFNFLFMF